MMAYGLQVCIEKYLGYLDSTLHSSDNREIIIGLQTITMMIIMLNLFCRCENCPTLIPSELFPKTRAAGADLKGLIYYYRGT